MPSSKKTAAMAPIAEYGQQAKAPTARAVRRTAAKATPAAQKAAKGKRAPAQPASAYTPTTWGQQTQGFEIECPSGQKCLAKELDIMRLIELGLLDRINGLTGIVNSQVVPKAKGQRVPEVDVASILQNKDGLREIMLLVDTIVCEAVIAPEVFPVIDEDGVPIPDDEREPDRIYTDSIRLTDRFHIFNEVTGGLDQLAAFR